MLRQVERNETVTMVKAFAIMLMVMAHAGVYGSAQMFISMFHMPVFFFCSGYCFKTKYLDDVRSFAVRRVKGIYWPYIKYALLFLLLHNFFFYLNIYNGEYGFVDVVSSLYDKEAFKGHLVNIVTKMADHESLLGGFWFMHTLFFASFIAFFTIKWMPNKLVGTAFLLLVCVIFKITDTSVLTWVRSLEFMAAAFFVFGHWYAGQSVEAKGWMAFFMFLVVVAGSRLMPASMLGYEWWGVVPYFLIALCGTYMTFHVSALCDRNSRGGLRRLLVFIGDHTLEILTWHFLSFKLVSLLMIWVEHRPIQQLACFPVIAANLKDYGYFTPWWPVYWVVGISVPLLIVYLQRSFWTMVHRMLFKKLHFPLA